MKFTYSFLCFFFLISCRSSVSLVLNDGEEIKAHSINDYINQSESIQSYFFGMQLIDLEKQEPIFNYNEDHYFTPASNTKLFTLYTAINYLADSVGFVEIYDFVDSLVYQPMGDPTFLHPRFVTDSRIKTFFNNRKEDTIIFNLGHFKDVKFGSGWAWDDYADYYQTEKSPFPLASNLIQVVNDEITPVFLPVEVYFNFESDFHRNWDNNQFFIPLKEDEEERYYPIHVDEQSLKNYFIESGKLVRFIDVDIVGSARKTIYSESLDSALTILMHDSDNHIAEQLLLQASQIKLNYMNTKDLINLAKEDLFSNSPDALNWVDGSGLSRYNLFTPRSINYVLQEIIKQKGIDWVKEILAVGGQSGTIKNYYSYDPPRVFAKTGTLRNNHNLSGIVQAKSGKWYVFSMMNNNYPGASSTAKFEMENILKLVIELY